MFKNIRYIDPKMFQEDGQPRYNINLTPTDWKSFTSFTDTDKTRTSTDLSNSSSTEYVVKRNIGNELYETEEGVAIYDKVFGLSLDGTDSSGDGLTLDTAIDYVAALDDGGVIYDQTVNSASRFYKFKMKANTVYTFTRDPYVGGPYFDDMIWFYDENKTNIWSDDDANHTEYSYDHDCICYVEINGFNHNNSGGKSKLFITPLPERVTATGKNNVVTFNSNNFIFGQNPFTYSFWYYKGEEAKGVLISMQSGNVSNMCFYISDGLLYFYDGVVHTNIAVIKDEYFNKKGINSPLHICFTYDFENTFLSVFLDGEYVYGDNIAINLICDSILFGGATIPGISADLDGTLKWIRTYNRALTEREVLSLYSEFDNCPGDGTSWTRAFGSIPGEFDNDTAYIIRRYNDDTKTYIQESVSEVDRFGIFGCPENSNSISENIPEEISACPWIGENGKVIIEQYNNTSSIKNNTVKHFIMKDLNVNKHKESSSYIFIFNTDASLGTIYFDNCRFSSDGCSIDTDNNHNENAGRYLISYGTINNFIMKNCNIVNTNVTYDAFRFVTCHNAVLRNVNIYTSPAERGYNSNCFSFMYCTNGADDYYGHVDGFYDDFYGNSASGTLRNLDMKNINMIIRGNTKAQVPGLILSNVCSRAKIDNINIVQGDNLTDTVSNIVAYNGVINLRWIYDYDIKNISINVSLFKRVAYWPLVMFAVTEPDEIVSTSQGAAQRHFIDNVNIIIGQSSSDTNSSAERDYFNTNSDFGRYFPLYSLFCVMSNNDPAHGIHIVKNCSVTAKRCAAVALAGVFGLFDVVNGKVRLKSARLDIDEFSSIYNSGIVNIWNNGELNIENLTVSNPADNNLITYNSRSNGNVTSHIFVKNSNCSIQKNNYSKSGSGENNAFIYCPNTTVNNGFQMRGMSHLILPVDIHRNDGHGISLRLYNNGSQDTAFRFPPEPYMGIAYNLTGGKRKMTMHFAEAESNITGNTYESMLDKLWIEVVTSENIYNSKVDGKWSEDESMWDAEAAKPFKFTLNMNLEQDEKVFVRVYYNVDTHVNGGLFLDPKIDWE